MKPFLIGIGAGVGFFGLCLLVGHFGLRSLEDVDLSLGDY